MDHATKTYHVQHDGSVWQLLVPGETAILQSDDRQTLVTLARELAKDRDIQIFVHDAQNQLEVVYTCVGGVETVHRETMPPLSSG